MQDLFFNEKKTLIVSTIKILCPASMPGQSHGIDMFVCLFVCLSAPHTQTNFTPDSYSRTNKVTNDSYLQPITFTHTHLKFANSS